MARAIQDRPDESIPLPTKAPPSLPGGTYEVEDLGRFINWITRVAHTRRRIDREIEEADLVMSEEEWEATGGDPEPVEPPPPLPDGDDSGTRGGPPGVSETK